MAMVKMSDAVLRILAEGAVDVGANVVKQLVAEKTGVNFSKDVSEFPMGKIRIRIKPK